MQPEQLPMTGTVPARVGLQRFEQVFHQDFRHCDCEMPLITKKWNDALGTFVAVRFCCMAKALEQLTGIKLYEVYDFSPKWEWDCAEIQKCAAPDGTDEVVFRPRGVPPAWLRKRLEKKNIRIYNDPET